MTSPNLVSRVVSIIPALEASLHKGQAGRIGVVGGCTEYTGAPYYAAIASLKCGADLSHVFCTVGAAPVIKSYSPELIVHPYLLESRDRKGMNPEELANEASKDVTAWLSRLHALVIGPGLGRDPAVLTATRHVINEAKKLNLPLVIDADGLFLVTQDPEIVTGYASATLTPNVAEFGRLYEKVIGKKPDFDTNANPHAASRSGEAGGEQARSLQEKAIELSKAMGNVTFLCKGEVDIITNGRAAITYSADGSPRRCGGQGDVLAGTTGTFTHWAFSALPDNKWPDGVSANMIAALGGSMLTRKCSDIAFVEHGRTMTVPDMIAALPKAFGSLFPGRYHH